MEPSRRVTELKLRQRWAGHILLDALEEEEYREAMWALLLDGALTQVELARQIGTTVGRLRPFLHGAAAKPDDFNLYEAWGGDRPRMEVVPDTVAIRLLTRHMTRRAARYAQARLATFMRDLYLELGTAPPEQVMHALAYMALVQGLG